MPSAESGQADPTGYAEAVLCYRVPGESNVGSLRGYETGSALAGKSHNSHTQRSKRLPGSPFGRIAQGLYMNFRAGLRPCNRCESYGPDEKASSKSANYTKNQRYSSHCFRCS